MPQNLSIIGQNLNLQGQPARITLFVGAYGSGKSEISVNYALWLAREIRQPGQRVVLCDLDTINPYYRSADAKALLNAHGIELIAPMYANTNVDVPAVPPGVFSVFDDESILAVLDIGGEDLGARVVGSLRERLAGQDFAINLVINPFRPVTESPEGIAMTADALSATIGLGLTGLVDNANLLDKHNLDLLIESFPVVAAGSRLTNLPILFAATMSPIHDRQALLQKLAQHPKVPEIDALADLPLLHLTRSIHYPTDPFARQN